MSSMFSCVTVTAVLVSPFLIVRLNGRYSLIQYDMHTELFCCKVDCACGTVSTEKITVLVLVKYFMTSYIITQDIYEV